MKHAKLIILYKSVFEIAPMFLLTQFVAVY